MTSNTLTPLYNFPLDDFQEMVTFDDYKYNFLKLV